MKDCSIQLTHHPGDLARVAQALARRGANIRALAVVSVGGPRDRAHYPRRYRSSTPRIPGSEHPFRGERSAHRPTREQPPGELAAVTNRLGDAGINLEALYVTGITDDLIEIAIVCDNPKKAQKLLEEF